MLLNRKGVSLVEMMIALVVLLLVFLALMQVALVSIDSNLKNLIRDEAVNIAEQRLTNLRNKSFTAAVIDGNLTAGTSNDDRPAENLPYPDPRNFRDIIINFRPVRTITDLNTDNKQITITVSWDWKGETFTHTVSTIKRRQ